MLTRKSAAVPCCCVERLKIARIPQAHKLPQASFRSRISKDVFVYPSLCTLFLTTQHPRSFLCLHSPEHWLSFTPCTLTKLHFSFLIQETNKNIFAVCFFYPLSNQPLKKETEVRGHWAELTWRSYTGFCFLEGVDYKKKGNDWLLKLFSCLLWC